MKRKSTIAVNLRLPKAILDSLDQLAAQGVIGETREEVVDFIVRTALFKMICDQAVAMEAAKTRLEPTSTS